MRAVIILLFLFNVLSMSAQYCCTEAGKVLHYVTTDKKEGKTLKDSIFIKDVADDEERTVVEQRWYGDSYSIASIMDGTNREILIYHKKSGVTDYIMLDAETENAQTRKRFIAHYPPKDSIKAEKEYQGYSKYIRAEGRICIPIKENAYMNEELSPCKYFQKMGPMKINASLKGKYKGKETIHTPAGDFECVKIYTESKGSLMFISQSEYSITWYAPNIGVVKTEKYTKRGKVLESSLLYAIH